MRSFLTVMLAGVFFVALAERPQLTPYGFVKGDMMIATSGVSSWGQPSPTAPFRATASDSETIAFSAQQSRFGLKGSASVKEMTFGGVVEMDFFLAASNTITNANPRLRLAYAWLQPSDGLDIRFGQQWDLFSPLNPTMNNIGSNLWMIGNYGFRRAQFQLRYKRDLGSVKPEIQISAGEGAKEGSGIGADNLSLMPLLQTRIAAAISDIATVGVSGVYGSFGVDKDYTVWGVSLDVNAPIHKAFALKGEFAVGSNLHDANLFTIAGTVMEKVNDTTSVVGNDRETMGFWINAVSKPFDAVHFAAGYGMELNQTEGISGGTLETNSTVFGDVIVPVGDYFSVVVEYQHFFTALASGTDYNAGVVSVTGKVSF